MEIIEQMSLTDAVRLLRQSVGLDPETDNIVQPEFLAQLTRRAALILGPASFRNLAKKVYQPLGRIDREGNRIKELVVQCIEELLQNGDLVELQIEEGTEKQSLIGLSRPRFLSGDDRALILGLDEHLGVGGLGPLSVRVRHRSYLRVITSVAGEDLPAVLRSLGLIEMPESSWLRAPVQCDAQALVADYVHRIERLPRIKHDMELTVIDPDSSVEVYRSRWRQPNRLNGKFVGRRSQVFGSDLWCYVEIVNGCTTRFIDLPLDYRRRGCDEAWHLQMALDSVRGVAQRFRVDGSGNWCTFRLFSPIPAWAQRRFELIGERVSAGNCLFAYKVPCSAAESIRAFLRDWLWLCETK